MSGSISLDRIARSIQLGNMADEMLDVLALSAGRTTPAKEHGGLLAQALDFVGHALQGFDLIEQGSGRGETISAAVENGWSLRDAEITLSSLRGRRDCSGSTDAETMRDLLDELRSGLDAIAHGQRLAPEKRALLGEFFDALSRVTLTHAGEMLRTRATERYRESLVS